MYEPGRYPPPDFGSPPPNSIQPFQNQQKPRASSFHPSMWSWSDTQPEAGWYQSGQAGWHRGSAAGFGSPSGRGNYGVNYPYYKNSGHERHQGGYRGGRLNHGPPKNHKRKNSVKEPEYSHYCDPCDRGFKDQKMYDEHISQHVKCFVSDCSFMAHEKIVKFHWKISHTPGAKRIKLDTPDDIARWREDRRRNYPTLQNIEKKRKVMKLREETGAVLNTAQFGQMRGRGRGRGCGWRGRGLYGQRPQGPSHSSAAETPPPPVQRCRDGDPLGALVSDHDSDRDDPDAESRTGDLVVPPKQMSSALGYLMASYGSTSESEEDEEPEVLPIQRAKDLLQENQALLNSVPPDTQVGGPSLCPESSSQSAEAHDNPQPFYVRHSPHSNRGRGGRGRRGGGRGQTRRPTLLEMLLAPDIRRERNVLLQCVRYVVRNNFFGLESSPQKQEGFKKETAPAIPTEEDEERKEKRSEGDEALHGSDSLAGGKSSSVEVDNQEDLETSEALLVDQKCQQSDPMNSEDSEDPEAQRVAGDLLQNGHETVEKDCHSLELTSTDEIARTLNVYDDEIWESPGVL